MYKTLVVIVLVLMAATPAAASDQTDVMATVHTFVDGFNKGDIPAAAAVCADECSIIDEFPPFAWHGSGALSSWASDYDADAKKNAISNGSVVLGKPRHVDVVGDRAYVVAPVNYTYKQGARVVKEVGSTLTVALHKSDAGWRITSWAWAKR